MTDSKLINKVEKLVGPHPFFIPRKKIDELLSTLKIKEPELMSALVEVIKKYSVSPISKYQVGIVTRTIPKKDYVLGVNLEFPGNMLNMTIHGEQFAVSLAYSLGDVIGFDIFAQQAPSCGHCVQFLNEIKNAKDIEYIIPEYKKAKLGSMMKYVFGPAALGLKTALFLSDEFKFESPKQIEMAATKAVVMAKKSYAPYSKCPGGAAIQTKDGEIYWGAYIENVAFNPIVTPFHGALIHMIASGKNYSDIKNVWVAEKENCSVSHLKPAATLLETLNPQTKIEVIKLK